jgi:hypothetical protein
MFSIDSGEEMAMTDARAHLVFTLLVSKTVAFIVAGLLIFVLGRQLSATSGWLIHMVAINIWDLFVLRLNALGFGQVLHFWPLLLVGVGLAILLALEPIRPMVAQLSRPSKLIETVR